MRIFDAPVLCVLLDDALDLRPWLSENAIRYVTIGDLVDRTRDEVIELLQGELGAIVDRSHLYSLDRRASLSYAYCTSPEMLEKMGWREFEHCTHNLLLYAVGTSSLLGGTEPGSGVPDGAFTLHGGDRPTLFMWDAKFVDLVNRDGTELRGEYDKIFRHLSEMQSQPPIAARFGDVSGIVLFSPGIKSANLVRLAQILREYDLLTTTDWEGAIAHFTLGGLCRLYDGVRNNDGGIQQKPDTFHALLESYLTRPERHEDDAEPDPIQTTTYDTVHVSEEDVGNVFDILSRQDPEREEFNREGYEELRSILYDL